MPASDTDLQVCREEVLATDPWFRLHFSFAPPPFRDRILVLHALFSALRRPMLMSEESLGLAQLAWWHQELSAEGARASAHPVVRALRESGSLETLQPALVESLLEPLPQLVCKPALQTLEDLRVLCHALGEARVMAEVAVINDGQVSPAADGSCAGSGLTLLVDLGLAFNREFWFLPLEAQARFQCNTRVLEHDSATRRAVLKFLGETGENWHRDQFTRFERAISAHDYPPAAGQHLGAWMSSQRIQLRRLLRSPRNGRRRRGRPWRLTDPIRVWRACRRVSRPAEEG